MLKGLGDIGQIMKLQKEFKNVQKKITRARAEGTSPEGGVTAVITGEHKIVSLSIDAALKASGGDDLEKQVIAAVNNGVDRIKEMSASEMNRLTGGLDIPGLGSFLK